MPTEGRFWPEMLAPSERAMLRRSDPVEGRDRHPDVLVVGGGILGIATARAAEDAGVGSVLLVEAGELGSGATGGALGLCTPEPHHGIDPEALVLLGRESLVSWRALDERLPGGVGLVDLTWIGLLDDERDIVSRSPYAELLSAGTVAGLVPGLGAPRPAMRIEGQARVNPLFAAARLAATLRAVATGERATAVRVRGGSVVGVATTLGELAPGAVVFALGGPPDLAGLPPALPADRVKGHVVVTEPTPLAWPGTVDPVATPLPDGRLLLGGTLDVGDDRASVTGATVEAMLCGLTAHVPDLAGIEAERAWCCFRPHHPDGLPTIDRVPGTDNAWFTSGHYRTGVLMAPATAGLLVEWVVTGQPPTGAAAFAASRAQRVS